MAEEESRDDLVTYADLLGDLRHYLDISCRISIEFGRKKMTVREILNLSCDAVISIPKSAGENVEVLASDKVIAHGEIITVEESTGVIITDIALDYNPYLPKE